MYKIIQRLRHLEEIRKRIKAFADVRGNPANVIERFHKESQTLKWAYDNLLSLYFNRVLCVVGQDDFIRELDGVQQYIVGKSEDTNVAWAIVVDLDQTIVDNIKQAVNPTAWEGNVLPDIKNTNWLS